MSGASTVDSHAWSWSSTICGPDANDEPSGESSAAQMYAGAADWPEFDFQYRYGAPFASTKGWGSMDPPRSVWQMKGAEEVSMNGPVGTAEVAIEMHWAPVAVTSVA